MLDISLTPHTTLRARSRANSPRTFYLATSLLMLVLVTYAFSRTIGDGLLHIHRPNRFVWLLSFHAAVFYTWMLLFVVQSALVRWRSLRVHRLLGWFGAVDAGLIVLMGLWASFAEPSPLALESIGVVSMAAFGIPVTLAILWRKRPAYHRRLLFLATSVLTNAAFARLPGTYLPSHFFYAGTDLLLAIAVAHDLWTEQRIHPVYRFGVPLLVAAEIAVLIPAWRYLG